MFCIERTTEILERTPIVVGALLGGLGPEWTERNYGEGTWSAYEVVGHLIVAERLDWLPRIGRILECGELRAFDPFPHDAAISPASGVGLATLLDEFAEQRAASLSQLRGLGLTAEDLERTGMHPALGRVSMSQLLAAWAAHDLHHLRQIGLAMAWQYRQEVGPWRAYLNTLVR